MTQANPQLGRRLVTIGMPVYNGEEFLRPAIESALKQDYRHFEFIISDNASTDSTEAICREYARSDSRIRYIRQSENCGGAKNFLFVLDEARGEYFSWLAADDAWKEETYLSDLVQALDSGADLAFSAVELLATKPDGHRFVARGNVMASFAESVSRFDYCIRTVKTCSHQIYGLFRKSALPGLLGYLKDEPNEGLFVQAAAATLTEKYVGSATALYHVHEKSVSGTSAPSTLLKTWPPYMVRCISFWLRQRQLTLPDRIRIVLASMRHNGYYVFRLFGASLYRKLTGSPGRKMLERIGVAPPAAH